MCDNMFSNVNSKCGLTYDNKARDLFRNIKDI